MELGIISVCVGLLFPICLWAALQWYFNRKYGVWERQGVPGERPPSFFHKYLSLRKLPVTDVDENYKKYGRLFGAFDADHPVLYVAEPELIRAVLVKDFQFFHSRVDFRNGDPVTDLMVVSQHGESWKRVRSIISPSFTSGKLRKMTPLVQDVIQTFYQHILELSEGGEIDFTKHYIRLTMALVARCAFGTKVKNMKDDNDPFIANVMNVFSPATSYRFKFQRLFPRLTKFLKLPTFPVASMNYFKGLSRNIMQQRRERKVRDNDFLQLILDALEGKLDTTQDEAMEQSDFDVGGSNPQNWKTSIQKKFVSENEALAQCVMFLFAGVHTTSTTLSYISYDLAMNPDYQEKLIEEVDAFWKEMKGEFDLADVNKLPLLEAFVSESLRLHTLGKSLDRETQEDYELPDKGIKIPKGTVVSIPIAAIHHDPEWYPEPDKFDPERFSPENKKTRNPYLYMPFGAGPRNCVANRFALMFMKLSFVHLLRHIRFIRTPNTMVPLEIKFIGQLLVPTSVILKVEARRDIPK